MGILWNKAENEGNFDIGIYQTDGENEGCYDTRDETLERLIRSYDKTMSLRGVDETVAILRSICKRVERCSDRDLIPVNNGIFDYGSKVLLGFDPSTCSRASRRSISSRMPRIRSSTTMTTVRIGMWSRG